MLKKKFTFTLLSAKKKNAHLVPINIQISAEKETSLVI